MDLQRMIQTLLLLRQVLKFQNMSMIRKKKLKSKVLKKKKKRLQMVNLPRVRLTWMKKVMITRSGE